MIVLGPPPLLLGPLGSFFAESIVCVERGWISGLPSVVNDCAGPSTIVAGAPGLLFVESIACFEKGLNFRFVFNCE